MTLRCDNDTLLLIKNNNLQSTIDSMVWILTLLNKKQDCPYIIDIDNDVDDNNNDNDADHICTT